MVEFIVQFQTLIAGVLALLGAVGTICYLIWQNKKEDRRRRRAAVASLPADLNAVIGQARECMRLAHWFRESLKAVEEGKSVADEPEGITHIDRTVIDNLALSLADIGGSAGEQIASLLNWHQIVIARLIHMEICYREPTVGQLSRAVSPRHAQNVIRDAARLYLQAEKLFETAREERDIRGDITDEDINRRIEHEFGEYGP